MKIIFEHIFEGIIAGVVVVGLILIFNNTSVTSPSGNTSKGFLNILGNQVSEKSTENITDNSAILTSIISQNKPEILYKDDGLPVIKSNSSINILNYFKVKFSGDVNIYSASSLGNKNISVIEITNNIGESIINSYNKTDRTIIFSSPGVYTFTFNVSDQENRSIIATIKIPVKS